MLTKKVASRFSVKKVFLKNWHKYFPVNIVKSLKNRIFYRTLADDCFSIEDLDPHSRLIWIQNRNKKFKFVTTQINLFRLRHIKAFSFCEILYLIKAFSFCEILYLINSQKQPSRGVLRKKCSESVQQILQENIHTEVGFQSFFATLLKSRFDVVVLL